MSSKQGSRATATTGQERVKALIISAGDKAPPSVRPYIHHLASFVALVLTAWELAYPYLHQALQLARQLHETLPDDLLCAILGLLMCFFGGTFSALIAAVEAFRMTGWEQTKRCALSLYEDYEVVREAHKKDEQEDLDGDGVADVSVLSPSELLARKTHLMLVSVKDPQKVSSALMGISSSCLSVIAVLRVEFAKTITLAVSIGDSMQNIIEAYVLPVVTPFVPEVYAHWIPTVVEYSCKSFAITVAWYISKVISAFHSGIRGGLMFSRHLLAYANKKGYTQLNHEDTNLDEIAGWILAGLGVLFQIRSGFSLPFPLNLILFPLTFCEWVIIWLVSDPNAVVV